MPLRTYWFIRKKCLILLLQMCRMEFSLDKWVFLRRKLETYRDEFRRLHERVAHLEQENVLLQEELDRLRKENEQLRKGLAHEHLKEEWVGKFVSPQAAGRSLDEMIKKLNRIIESLKHETGEG